MYVESDPTIESIRKASRQLVRELGFLKPALAATRLPPSAVHALVELDLKGSMTALQLGELLDLEKSSISRMLKKLLETGEIKENTSEVDGRVKWLILTGKGRRTVGKIHNFARAQVAEALQHLAPVEHEQVLHGLALYAKALEARRTGARLNGSADSVEIQRGYVPGMIGRIVEMHARYYSRTAGFGQYFERKVAAELAEFAARLENPRNDLWVAVRSGVIVGSIAIDGEDMGTDTAHLRWFIVEDGARGSGIGKRLLHEAIRFCDGHGFPSTTLWTFHGLNAARRLYESMGFDLVEELAATQWGQEVLEQRFVRLRHA